MNETIEPNVGDRVYVHGEESQGIVTSVDIDSVEVKLDSDGCTVSCAHQQLSRI